MSSIKRNALRRVRQCVAKGRICRNCHGVRGEQLWGPFYGSSMMPAPFPSFQVAYNPMRAAEFSFAASDALALQWLRSDI